MGDANFWQVILGLITVSITITGTAVWVLRAATRDVKDALNSYSTAMREEFKEFTKGVDTKLDGFNIHIDHKVEGVKTYVRDVSLKSDVLAEKIHQVDREILILRTSMPENFVTRREMEEIRKRVTRLEPTARNSE